MEEELDLRQIFAVIRKRWLMILLIPLAALLVSAYISYFYLIPQYRASTTLMVLHAPAEIVGFDHRASDISYSRQLVKSYGEIVKSRRVAERAVAMADADKTISYSSMLSKIDVGLVRDTEFINISVTDPNPEMAAYWANLVTEAFKMEVFNIMRVENVNLLDTALPPSQPFSPNRSLNMAIAGVLGLMAALGLAFVLEFLDRTIKIPKDVTDTLQLPTLGAIPDFSKHLK